MNEKATPVGSNRFLAEINPVEEAAKKVKEASHLLPSRSEVLEQAIEVIKLIEEDEEKAEALSAIAPYLSKSDPELLKKALTITQSIEDDYEKAFALGALAPKIQKTIESSYELLKKLLEVTQTIQDERIYTTALSTVSSKLTESQRSRNLEEALELAEKIENKKIRINTLANIVEQFLGLESKLVIKSLTIALGIREPSLRVEALSAITSCNFRHDFLARALTKIEEKDFSSNDVLFILPLALDMPSNSAIKVLAHLSNSFSEEIVQQFPNNKLDLALEIVAKGNTEDKVKTRFLSALAPRLSLSSRLFQKALTIIKESIKEPKYLLDAFCNLIPYLPEGQFSEAIGFIKYTIEDSSEQIEAFQEMIPHLSISDLLKILKLVDEEESKEETIKLDDLANQIKILVFVSNSISKFPAFDQIRLILNYQNHDSSSSHLTEEYKKLINKVFELIRQVLKNLNGKAQKDHETGNEDIVTILENLAPIIDENQVSDILVILGDYPR